VELTASTRLTNGLRLVGAVVVALAVPTFLLTNAVRSVTLDESLYMSEFSKYRIGAVTGLSDSELRRVAGAFISYFQSEPKELRTTVTLGGAQVSLFNEREIAHMVDVQRLVRLVLQIRTLALGLFILGTVAIIATGPSSAAPIFFRATAIGGAAAVLLIGALSVAAALDFDQLFMQFHFMSFSNDLWLLDPRRDRLIQLFPEGFFYDFALRIGIQTVGLGLSTLVASLGLLFSFGGRQTTH